jgi:UDP-N-acetylmuramoyl-tripeptide--D-alanyl-D-alanine ligase
MLKQILKKIVTHIILAESRVVIKKYKPKIIAITGSVGKTSTKDAIYTALSKFYFIRKSSKSFNSEIGVPLTILGCPNGWNSPTLWMKNILEGLALIFLPNRYPEWLVLEIGVDKPGDMDQITSWLRPDVVILTQLSKVPVHVEFFSSPQAVMEEKGKLIKAVKPDGVVILNADDEDVLDFKNKTSAKTILFSANGNADLVASNYSVNYEEKDGVKIPKGATFRLDYNNTSIPITINGSLGKQYIYTSLAALSVGLSQNLNLVELASSLSEHITPPGRMKILSGIKKTTILDDTYNSSPIALSSAIDTLASLEGKRKIAVLGDMMELGKYSTEEHRQAGMRVADECNILVTVGLRARFFAEGAIEGGMKEKMIFKFEDSRQAGEYLKKSLKKGDIVLVKGSQSIRMERVVEAVMAEPELAKELLVRQEDDWLKR